MATSPGSPSILPTRPKKIHFAIYYYTFPTPGEPDAAFERAAKTWERQFVASSGDEVILKVVLTEGTFRQAWNEIYQRVESWPCLKDGPSVTVGEGHVFSHAASGLEFKPLEIMSSASAKPDDSPEEQERRTILREILKATREDGTLAEDEIRGLPRLPWDPQDGLLVLHGCHTGDINPRAGSIIGKIFAESQQVRTIGQRGSANFSAHETFRYPINNGTLNVYLWAYDEPVNLPPAQQTKFNTYVYRPARPGVVFLP